jgi:hypothetical protein
VTDLIAQLDLPEPHLHALHFLLKQVPPPAYTWALTGSGSLRLQGVDVPVHDLDIQADKETVYRIEEQLAGFMINPVHLWESTGMVSLDGKAVIEGIQIELLANVAHRQPDGTWCTYTDFSRLIWVKTHELRIPVFPLEDELAAYKAMGRIEKATLIRQAILATRK